MAANSMMGGIGALSQYDSRENTPGAGAGAGAGAGDDADADDAPASAASPTGSDNDNSGRDRDDQEQNNNGQGNAIDFWHSELKWQYDRLYWRFEVEKIKHSLAEEYYSFRAFWFVFIPLLLLTTASTILGFLAAGEMTENTDFASIQNITCVDRRATALLNEELNNLRKKEDETQVLAIAVGTLGAISTALNSLGKYKNYQSNADMHKSAVKALENICKRIWGEKEKVTDHKVLKWCSDRHATKITGDDDAKIQVRIEAHNANFESTLETCDSIIPAQIEQSFAKLEELFHKKFDCEGNDGLGSGSFEDDINHRMMKMKSWRLHYRAAYMNLWKEYTKRSWCFLNGPSFPFFIKEVAFDVDFIGRCLEGDEAAVLKNV